MEKIKEIIEISKVAIKIKGRTLSILLLVFVAMAFFALVQDEVDGLVYVLGLVVILNNTSNEEYQLLNVLPVRNRNIIKSLFLSRYLESFIAIIPALILYIKGELTIGYIFLFIGAVILMLNFYLWINFKSELNTEKRAMFFILSVMIILMLVFEAFDQKGYLNNITIKQNIIIGIGTLIMIILTTVLSYRGAVKNIHG